MNKKFLAVSAMMLLLPIMMGAQALKGSYFLDNSLNRNKLNPAFVPNSNYFQIPAIGNLGVGLYSNLTIPTFFYPSADGREVYTFLNKNVPVSQFEKALPRKPYLDADLSLNLVNFGFKTKVGFFTFDTGIKANIDADIPADLFLFMKKGSSQDGVYNIGAFKANVCANAYAAVGFARDLSDLVPGLKGGAKARFLLPIAQAGLNLNNVSLTTSAEKWTVKTDGTVHTAMSGLELAGPQGNISPSFDFSQLGLAGFGLSFDLGAEYQFDLGGLLGIDNFFISSINFSAAVTDLGFISYKKDILRGYKTSGQMDWSGLALSLEDGAMNDAMGEIKDQVGNLTKIEEIKTGFDPKTSTLPSFYVGAEVEMLDNLMSVGLLYSARKSWFATRNEMTLSYNLNPCKWFGFGINYSFLSSSSTLGTILEFTPRIGPCLILGLDYVPLEFAKMPESIGLPMLPTAFRLNFRFGLSFAIGGGK